MRGRKPTPAHLKLVTGNPGKRATKPAPQAPGALNDAPDWLTDSQKTGWRFAIDNAPKGLLRRIDGSVLTAWVIAEDLHRHAAEQIAKFGMLMKTPNGMAAQSPYLAICNRQAQIMCRAAEQLGFSPVSRARVAVEPDQGKQNPFAALDAFG